LSKVLIINQKDNVAVAIKKMEKDQKYFFNDQTINIADEIFPTYKIAIKNIKKGDNVIKYGEIIGKAIKDIKMGEFVHVHNVEGIRGRGDKVKRRD
jgi:hypothetical protein